MKISKFFLALLLTSFAFPGFTMASDAPGFTYSKVDSVVVNQEMVTDGSSFNVLENILTAELTSKQITKPGVIEFMELNIPNDSIMSAPNGFIPVAPVIEYKLRNTQLKRKQEIKLTIPFESDLKFKKFSFYWSYKKQAWREVESVTDLEKNTVTLTMSLNNSRILVTDTDPMVQGHASWYRFKKCMCAASPDYPRGSQLLVTNMNKGESILVKVNDWGPERDLFPDRVIDLDVVAFEKLGSRGTGVLKNIRVVPFVAAGYSPEQVKDLLAGKKIVIDEALIAPYIPQKKENKITIAQ